MHTAEVGSSSLATVLRDLGTESATGCLHVTGPTGDEARLYLSAGGVYAARVPGRVARLGDRLVTTGMLSPEVLSLAAAGQDGGQRLDDTLVAMGEVDRSAVEAAAREQLTDAVWDVLGWGDARWRFRRGEETHRDIGPVPVADLLAELDARAADWAAFEAVVPGGDAVPTLAGHGGPAEVEVDTATWAVLCLVDGTRTVAELAAHSALSVYETTRTLVRLVEAGLVEVRPAVPVQRTPSFGAPSYAESIARVSRALSDLLGPAPEVEDPFEVPHDLRVRPSAGARTDAAEDDAETLRRQRIRAAAAAELAAAHAMAEALRREEPAAPMVEEEPAEDEGPIAQVVDLEAVRRQAEDTARRQAEEEAAQAAERERERAAAEAAERAAAEVEAWAEHEAREALAAAQAARLRADAEAAERAAAEVEAWAEYRERQAAERAAAEVEAWAEHEYREALAAAQAARLRADAEAAERAAAEPEAWAEHHQRQAAERAAAEPEAWAEHEAREALAAAEAARLRAEAEAAERAAAEPEAWAEHEAREALAAEEAARAARADRQAVEARALLSELAFDAGDDEPTSVAELPDAEPLPLQTAAPAAPASWEDDGWAVRVTPAATAAAAPVQDDNVTDTAALLRELSSLGMDDDEPAPPTPHRPRPSASPVDRGKQKKRGFFGR